MLTPGEIQVGNFITVHHWQRLEHDQLDVFGFPVGGTTSVKESVDNSYKGEVLEVLAVCLPFVSVIRRDVKYKEHEKPFKLDTRQAILMELSPEYVKSLL